MNELDKWIGWLSLRMGGLMAVASASLWTASNCAFSSSINGSETECSGTGKTEGNSK
jgi:hypothetical protein